MRTWMLAVFTVLASATTVGAQNLARVEVTASLHVPQFMTIEQSRVVDATRDDGTRVRRVTLLISANCTWRLEVSPTRADVTWAASKTAGRAARQEEVTVELVWKPGERAPGPDEVAYSLIGA